MKRLIFLTLICILLMTVQARAEITPQLIQEWEKQPNNVRWNLYYQPTSINVVDTLPWVSPDLYDTWAYTSTYKTPAGMVDHLEIVIQRGNEYALTHEVGHCISHAGRVPWWWCYRAEFIQIWQNERFNCPLLVGQGADDIREYFACAYDAYIRYPQLLKNCCPNTYNYITVVLKYT